MANLTLSIDDDLLKRARIRALEHGTSVNALVRDYLASYAGRDAEQAALEEFLDIARKSHAGREASRRTWTRDEIHVR